ncbi:enoyl-CoA hydratase [Bacillus thermotolerans]|uniref:Enoyl-CoA hydratase n=1 Tax=Bacillus thermotolerans TaxID=1221996 RepID=A0A0F5HP42_BACTR|nr:enoyl-CoA hydratase [Bacillus thermotolerans]KKB34825.1 Enoyl-CoA hydratase [Bacillus thermotolerans]KKB37190.1 Enoyl-CoA hydratase [Bacillus thermotolerans]KKB43365.1 Enoyl-CoA hydratase [Bacillus thermotolerans]
MEYISLERRGRVAEMVIQRPPANALSSSLITDIEQALNQLEQDREIRVVLLRGEGKFFSAGADIKEFTTVKTGEEFSKLAVRGQQVFERIESFSKPIIAAIHGAALGGGLELAMSCHIRLVSERAKLGLPELSLGLVPGFAGSQRLPRYVGTAKAAELLLTSEPLTGEEAVRWGLANHAYPEEELFSKARELADKIAEKSPVSMKAAIELLGFAKSAEYYKGADREAQLFGEVFESQDAKEGIGAFVEKRKPKFIGQ